MGLWDGPRPNGILEAQRRLGARDALVTSLMPKSRSPWLHCVPEEEKVHFFLGELPLFWGLQSLFLGVWSFLVNVLRLTPDRISMMSRQRSHPPPKKNKIPSTRA